MTTIHNILFPVDFSPSCVAMALFVKRAAVIFGAKVTLVHVFDLYSHDAFQLYVRPISEVAEEQQNLARDKLDSFLNSEFPLAECPRILSSGDAAAQIVQLARTNGFDLIIEGAKHHHQFASAASHQSDNAAERQRGVALQPDSFRERRP